MIKLGRVWLLSFGALTLLLAAIPTPVTAALANVSHSYYSEGTVTDGSLVSLDPNRSGYIEPANDDNGIRLSGIAVEAKQSLLAVNPSSATVQIATTGNANALVTTANGNISVGDQISVSPFNGIGMKAQSGLSVIGLAQTSLTSKSPGVAKEEVRNKKGQITTIYVGYVSITMDITTNSSSGQSKLNGLQKLVQSLTGHVVSTIRIIISLIVIFITALALLAVIYSAIYGSIISVGRNPLARHAIFGTLRSVLLMTLSVAAVACVTVYLLLG